MYILYTFYIDINSSIAFINLNILDCVDQSISTSCFNCYGDTSNEEFVKNEQKSYNSVVNDENQSHRVILFGHSFNKGHTLVYDIPILFKMAK